MRDLLYYLVACVCLYVLFTLIFFLFLFLVACDVYDYITTVTKNNESMLCNFSKYYLFCMQYNFARGLQDHYVYNKSYFVQKYY